MKAIEPAFYKSLTWKRCRAGYISRHPLCERCLELGKVSPSRIVHHIQPLTPETVCNYALAYGDDNLQAVCFACHEEIHERTRKKKRYRIDPNGNLLPP